VIFAKCRDFAVIFRVFVIINEYLHEYLTCIEYKLPFFAISAQKSFGTNLLLHISRALLLTYSAIGMHVVFGGGP